MGTSRGFIERASPSGARLDCGGQLKVLDTFVTDRSFDEFCDKHGTEINLALIDPATAKWLIEEYGVPSPSTDGRTVGRAQKHALVVRTCKCGRKIAGNVYFKHAKTCKASADQAIRQAVEHEVSGRPCVSRTRVWP
jgi:hypothetical protein